MIKEGDRMHLIVDFQSSNICLMTDKHDLANLLNKLAEIAEMQAVGEPIVIDFPWPGSNDCDALSAVCFLEESAITVHTYPEKQFAFVDVFSCKDFNANNIIGHIIRAFKAKSPTILILDRGIDMKSGKIIPARLRGEK